MLRHSITLLVLSVCWCSACRTGGQHEVKEETALRHIQDIMAGSLGDLPELLSPYEFQEKLIRAGTRDGDYVCFVRITPVATDGMIGRAPFRYEDSGGTMHHERFSFRHFLNEKTKQERDCIRAGLDRIRSGLESAGYEVTGSPSSADMCVWLTCPKPTAPTVGHYSVLTR